VVTREVRREKWRPAKAPAGPADRLYIREYSTANSITLSAKMTNRYLVHKHYRQRDASGNKTTVVIAHDHMEFGTNMLCRSA
jgi:hypothetical protein